MRYSHKFICVWVFLFFFNLSGIAQEESAVIKNLSKKADLILTGKVTQIESNWNESKTRIYTTTTVEVEEFLKGTNNTDFVEITTPGGEVGEIGEIYTHMPRFTDDEELLVFLKKDEGNNQLTVLNGQEGKITVFEDADTREKVTATNLPIKDLKKKIESYLSEQ